MLNHLIIYEKSPFYNTYLPRLSAFRRLSGYSRHLLYSTSVSSGPEIDSEPPDADARIDSLGQRL